MLAGDSSGIGWATYFLLGVPLGAATAALVSGDLALRMPAPGRFLAQLAGGGLMGLGAGLAGGCNIGHGITGISALSVTSVVATAATIAGVWGATWLVYRKAARLSQYRRT